MKAKFGSEHPRLVVGPPGEPPTADAAREAEVVADQGARGGLAADAALVDHQRAEALGGPVHGRRQARRPGADDDDVEVHRLGVDGRSGGDGDLGVGRVLQDRAVGEHDDRQRRAPSWPPRRAHALGRSRRGRSCARWRTAGAPRAARGPDPTTTRPTTWTVYGAARWRLGPVEQQSRDRLVEQLVG